MRARAPYYCVTGITANQNMTGNAPPARLHAWFWWLLTPIKMVWMSIVVSECVWMEGTQKFGFMSESTPKSATAECKSHAVRASQVTLWERPAWWLIRSRASPIVLFSGRADHWFPALCYCSCRREAAAGIARLLRVLSAEQWAAAPTTTTTTPLPPSPFHVCGADLFAAPGKCKLTNVQSACEASFA